MGYYSQVYLKTTTEGWLILKRVNDYITEADYKPLAHALVEKTPLGNYKISFKEIKWYEGYPQVNNFKEALIKLEEQEIPYSFIRIGEDTGDVEHKRSYPDDMPPEIEYFEPVVDITDEESSYEVILDEE